MKVLHENRLGHRAAGMRRLWVCGLAAVVAFAGLVPLAQAGGQGGYPGGGGLGGRPGMGPTGSGSGTDEPSAAPSEKPEAAAKKAFNAGMKSLNRAKEFEDLAAKSADAGKKTVAQEKAGDAYDRALDQFTEALRNRADMFEAWNHVGYIHLRLGAYRESIDDYNHTLMLKPDLLEAIEHRAEALLAIDRLDDVKMAYMDLFNHDRPLADQLMAVMQKWLQDHRAAANGMRPADIDAFGQWLQEREGIAKTSAAP